MPFQFHFGSTRPATCYAVAVATLAVSLGFGARASAVVLAQDDFSSPNGGTGFNAGNSWERHDAANGQIDTSLGGATPFRDFATPIPVSTLDKIYIRYDHADNDGDGTAWGGLAFFTGTEAAAGAEQLFVGNPSTPNNFGLGNLDNGGDLDSGVPVNSTAFRTVIAEVDIDAAGAGNHRFSVWVDNLDLNSPNATGTRVDAQTSWGTLRILGDGNEPFRADNVIIATTPGEVGLVPEPASAGLLGLAGLLLGARRRRRA